MFVVYFEQLLTASGWKSHVDLHSLNNLESKKVTCEENHKLYKPKLD